jgi:hypothetical protein
VGSGRIGGRTDATIVPFRVGFLVPIFDPSKLRGHPAALSSVRGFP